MKTIEEPVRTWDQDAACRGEDPSMWYPPPLADVEGRMRMFIAMRICESCPVKQECLDYSLEWEREGIWGGIHPKERDMIRRERKIELKRPR